MSHVRESGEATKSSFGGIEASPGQQPGQALSGRYGLTSPERVEVDVTPALQAPFAVPIGLAVPDEEQVRQDRFEVKPAAPHL